MLLSNKACDQSHPGFLLWLLVTLPVRALAGIGLLMLVLLERLMLTIIVGWKWIVFAEPFEQDGLGFLGLEALVWIFGYIAFADDDATLICRYDLFNDEKRHWVYPSRA